MAGKVTEICQAVIEPIINGLGYSLLEIEYAKKVDGMNLTITIDGPNGINIVDCERVHRAIDQPLDELNPTADEPYILSVSSPGLDRPIKNHLDFLRNEGKEVEIKLYAKQDGKKQFVGLLSAFDDDNVTIKCGEKYLTFTRDKVAIIEPVLKF